MDEEKKVPQHALISECTDHLCDAIRGLENLVDEVDGQEKGLTQVEKKEVDEIEIEKTLSLSQFLNSYPERIETLNKRVTEATNRMKVLLF